MLQPPFEDIEDLHEYVFQYLLKMHEEDNNFKFTLRQPHQFISGKMQHWFYGDDDSSLYFSCWRNQDTQEKLHLYFRVNKAGDLSLSLRLSKTNSIQNNTLKNIYSAITNDAFNSRDYVHVIPLHKITDVSDFKKKWELIDKMIVALGSNNNFMTVIDYKDFKKRLDYIQTKRNELKTINEKRQQSYNTN